MITSKRKILIVEDSDTMWGFYSDLLDAEYTLLRASEGRQALRHVVRSRPDLVLLDWTLDDIRPWDEEFSDRAFADRSALTIAQEEGPVMSGLDVLRVIKRSEFKRVPVIMLTGRKALHERLIGRLYRADKYLTKPVAPSVLVEAVHALAPVAPRPVGTPSATVGALLNALQEDEA